MNQAKGNACWKTRTILKSMTSVYHLDEENNQVCLGRESKKVCWGSITVECEMVGLREREREKERMIEKHARSTREYRSEIG